MNSSGMEIEAEYQDNTELMKKGTIIGPMFAKQYTVIFTYGSQYYYATMDAQTREAASVFCSPELTAYKEAGAEAAQTKEMYETAVQDLKERIGIEEEVKEGYLGYPAPEQKSDGGQQFVAAGSGGADAVPRVYVKME